MKSPTLAPASSKLVQSGANVWITWTSPDVDTNQPVFNRFLTMAAV